MIKLFISITLIFQINSIIPSLNYSLFNNPFGTSQPFNEKSLKKLAKDYTNKFCNGISFGLSNKSAMEFAINENYKSNKNKMDFVTIDDELLSNEVVKDINDKCGFRIGLSSEEDIDKFKIFFSETLHNINPE